MQFLRNQLTFVFLEWPFCTVNKISNLITLWFVPDSVKSFTEGFNLFLVGLNNGTKNCCFVE